MSDEVNLAEYRKMLYNLYAKNTVDAVCPACGGRKVHPASHHVCLVCHGSGRQVRPPESGTMNN